MDELGYRIKEYAKSKHGSVRNLAKAIDKQESLISQYITGTRKPGSDFLMLLAKDGCDVNWLLTGEKKSSNIKDPQEENSAESVVVKKDHFEKLSDLVEKLSKRVEELEKSK